VTDAFLVARVALVDLHLKAALLHQAAGAAPWFAVRQVVEVVPWFAERQAAEVVPWFAVRQVVEVVP